MRHNAGCYSLQRDSLDRQYLCKICLIVSYQHAEKFLVYSVLGTERKRSIAIKKAWTCTGGSHPPTFPLLPLLFFSSFLLCNFLFLPIVWQGCSFLYFFLFSPQTKFNSKIRSAAAGYGVFPSDCCVLCWFCFRLILEVSFY